MLLVSAKEKQESDIKANTEEGNQEAFQGHFPFDHVQCLVTIGQNWLDSRADLSDE